MIGRSDIAAFCRSREGAGLAAMLLFSAGLALAAGFGFYRLSLTEFTENKADEATTALRLVDAFVNTYSGLRGGLGGDHAPVPSSFRARSIELFNRPAASDASFRLRWIGRAGRSITTAPSDSPMAETIEAMAGVANPQPRSEFLTIGNERLFRTIYPSVASQKSCVDCHNSLQPDLHWQLGDVMGAFSIDIPAGPALAALRRESIGIGALLFLLIGGIGLWISLTHYRRAMERDGAQERLAASEARFRDFAEASSDWFWEQDADLRICFVSENEVSRRLGSTPAAQLGRTRREVVTLGVGEEQWRAHEADQAARRPFQRFRFQRIDVNGELRHVELNGKPCFDALRRFTGYRGTARDVTAEIAVEIELARRVEERTAELRHLQDELLRNERMSTLGQLTATIAHELRNPLSAIRNTAFAISEATAARGLALDRPMARLERSIGRCDRLITDLLDYTRLRELNRRTLSLDAWIEDLLEDHLLPDGCVLRRNFAATGVHAAFDSEAMGRALINLVDNATQALVELPLGAERVVTVKTHASDLAVRIVIEDTGPGIAPAILPKIFDPLFSTKSFGTGLGLPTVRRVLDQHGGAIEIASEPGKGTQVVVTLPLTAHPIQELAA